MVGIILLFLEVEDVSLVQGGPAVGVVPVLQCHGKVLGEAVVEEAGKSFLDGLGGESLVIALEAGCLGDFQGHGGVVASQPQHGHDLEQLGKAQAGKQGGGEGGV